jgi:hypothetical protein
MLKYLYIPENIDLDEYINFAVDNNFNQIIHGESEIIKDLIKNKDSVQEINIPEYRILNTDFLVFKENENFSIKLIDEFIIENLYEIEKVNLYRVDDIKINEKKFITSFQPEKINNLVYRFNLCIDQYGEYVFEIICKENESGQENILFEDKIIIYKEYLEEERDEKFFFSG